MSVWWRTGLQFRRGNENFVHLSRFSWKVSFWVKCTALLIHWRIIISNSVPSARLFFCLKRFCFKKHLLGNILLSPHPLGWGSVGYLKGKMTGSAAHTFLLQRVLVLATCIIRFLTPSCFLFFIFSFVESCTLKMNSRKLPVVIPTSKKRVGFKAGTMTVFARSLMKSPSSQFVLTVLIIATLLSPYREPGSLLIIPLLLSLI